MKKLLLILLCLPMIGFGQLGDYYKPNGHPKAKGLKFQIKTPLGFEQMEADRPNIVQKWIKHRNDNNKLVMFMVLVLNLPEEMRNISKAEWRQYLKYESGVDEFTENFGKMAKNAKYYVLDNYPGIYYEGFMEMDRLDQTFKLYHKTAQVFTPNHMFQIQMSVGNENLLETNEYLFNSLANSVIILDQYSK